MSYHFIHFILIQGISDVATFGWIQLRYTVLPTANKDYSISFHVSVCSNQTNCFIDANVIEREIFTDSSCNVSSAGELTN